MNLELVSYNALAVTLMHILYSCIVVEHHHTTPLADERVVISNSGSSYMYMQKFLVIPWKTYNKKFSKKIKTELERQDIISQHFYS